MLYPGMVLQDRYEIVKTIGHGGMSTVYLAKDQKSGNLLAVKDVARTGSADNQIVEQSLVGEGRMLKQLSDPHLPKIYDIIENADSFMLVMDYIEGESLDKVIARQGKQDMQTVLDWGMQICQVFDYLHNQPTPIIYRDMKPANVILKPDGQLTMIDFGTARTQKLGVQMQADTVCIGTAGFAAPEQFGGIGQSDARTDIFCLGATLYNMITGHSPCDKPTGILALEYWDAALGGTPIAQIIYKCTRNDPNERYQTAMELHDDLWLASTGAFRSPSGDPKSGGLGGFRKVEWQKQDVKGIGAISGGLSGLIQRTITGEIKEEKQPEQKSTQSSVRASGGGWQSVATTAPEKPKEQTVVVVQQEIQTEAEDIWTKLMLIGAILSVVFLVLAAILIFTKNTTAGAVFLIIAVGAAALAVVGLIRSRNPESQ